MNLLMEANSFSSQSCQLLTTSPTITVISSIFPPAQNHLLASAPRPFSTMEHQAPVCKQKKSQVTATTYTNRSG
ncbi:hypothetical protein HanPI659440_Chr11g0423581 [Helianthus annuus]|nr:hypothetical protein HanPI659440_Chr11g0423581 [Helianthus annuus]